MKTDLGYIRGAQGEVGPQGETGAQGPAATIEVGSVTTSAYGTPAKVVNSGTENAARFDFTIPQGAPGETVADVSELTANFITESTESYPTYTVTEKMKVILGKIKKYLADLKSEAASLASKIIAAEKNITNIQTDVGEINTALTGKLDKTDVIANLTATEAGKVLDATQGKALQDQITQLNSELPIDTKWINDKYYKYRKIGNIVFIKRGGYTPDLKAGEIFNIGTLPAEFRPSDPIVKTLAYYSNKTWEHYYFSVEVNGEVRCISSKDTNYVPPYLIDFALK